MDENGENWVVLGYIGDKMSADFAKSVLASYEIPAVVISKSGYFGQVGLPLNTVYKHSSAHFEISVPSEHIPEATAIIDMALGENWQKEVE